MKRDRLNNLYIAIIQVIIVSSINYSQILQNKFSHYTVDDGILSNIVNEVMQDRIGYLWLATSNGLTRYDGYEFVNFSPNMNDSTALQLPLLSTLFEDSEGDIWIGGVQGISKYNRNTGMFKNYSLKKYEDELNEFYVVTDLEETEDKEILATLYSFDRENIAAGLLKYKNDLDNFEIIDLIGNDSTNALAKIKKIGKTLFLVSGTRGIGEFNTTDKIINWLPIEENTIVTSFLEEDDQTLWLGTINKGLVKYNRRDFTFTKYVYSFYQSS